MLSCRMIGIAYRLCCMAVVWCGFSSAEGAVAAITEDRHKPTNPLSSNGSTYIGIGTSQASGQDFAHPENHVPSYTAALGLQQYIDDYNLWKSDGERFMAPSFIQEWVNTGVIPVLGDERPEFYAWLLLTSANNVFEMEWGGRRPDALEFLRQMNKALVHITKDVDDILANAAFSISS